MKSCDVAGRVHSCQSLGTVDGPGVRFVVFMQGCPLRCAYCHNPDTWDMVGGQVYTPQQLMQKIVRCRAYFGEQGGITLSGGEALMQPIFARELFALCREAGIHTALDTSGCRLDGDIRALLNETDLVLLDIKMNTQALYHRYTGGSLRQTLAFLDEAQDRGLPVWIRQVVVVGINDREEDVRLLCGLLDGYSSVQRVELLPMRRLCLGKYEKLGVPFPLGDTPEPEEHVVRALQEYIDKHRRA